MAEKIEAYWFAASDRLPHGDGRKIVIGEAHTLKGEIVICEHALHASRHPFDALRYAPGPYLYKVLCSGDVVEHSDKLGCRRREYVARIDAADLLRQFAREQASSVLHLWDAPQVVKDYLATGDENLRLAAWTAAEAAAWTAAEAADAAAWTAAWTAAGSAAEAARSVARSAAEAARSAARSAARLAARLAAEAAGAARNRFAEMVEAAFNQSETK